MLSDKDNTSAEEISNLLKSYFGTEIIYSKTVSMTLTTLFPNIVKSKVRGENCNSTKISYRVKVANQVSVSPLNFLEIPNALPPEWFVIKKSAQEISCGHIFPAKSNGQDIILHVMLSCSGFIIATIAETEIDLDPYGIPSKLTFTHTSVPALFRSFKVIKPCLGYSSEDIKNRKISMNTKIARQSITYQGKSYFAVRSKTCAKILQIRSTGNSCLKCIGCISSMKRKLEQDKENIKTNMCKNEQETNETLKEKLKSLAPNLCDKQLLLIESQIKASNRNKQGIRWDKDIISMSISKYNRNPGVYRDIIQNGWLVSIRITCITLQKLSKTRTWYITRYDDMDGRRSKTSECEKGRLLWGYYIRRNGHSR